MRHFFQAEQWLPYPIETVFAFFANPENLPPLMPAWQKARIEKLSIVPPPPRSSAVAALPKVRDPDNDNVPTCTPIAISRFVGRRDHRVRLG